MLQPRSYGSRRDERILRYLETLEMLDTEQIQCLVFRSIKSSLRTAQRRLAELKKAKRLNRFRFGDDMPYVYHLGRPPKPITVLHSLMRNWVYVWFNMNLGANEYIYYWKAEEQMPFVHPDAFLVVKNQVTGAYTFYFIEIDRGTSRNEFDKVPLYTMLAETGAYADTWWASKVTTFPTVVVVTDSTARMDYIKSQIVEQNRLGLNFNLRLFSALRKECLERVQSVERPGLQTANR